MSSIGGDDQHILVTFLILGGGGMILRFLEVIFVFRSLVVPGPAFFRPIFWFKFLHAQQWVKIEIIGGMEVKYWGDLQPCIIKTFIKHCLQENIYKTFGLA